eukprot:TRINITY_DN11809_c0_g3_i1.p1 TRINITY_DN11809_c0_g3~~TRINITY_DN11809_c0_g3_i1.p1  ORF type:complete len:1262 (+),score=275.34 TRINITY_DN11809_c0_g3_i1:69-3854(+)
MVRVGAGRDDAYRAALFLGVLVAVAASADAGDGGEGRRLRVSRGSAAAYHERGQLPVLDFAGLRLTRFVASGRGDPWHARDVKVRKRHGLKHGEHGRRLYQLAKVQNLSFNFMTPRSTVRSLAVLAAASMDAVMFNGTDTLLQAWGSKIYEDNNEVFYPKPPCRNLTSPPVVPFPGYDPSYDSICADSPMSTTSTTTGTTTVTTTTVTATSTTWPLGAVYPPAGENTVDFEAGGLESGGLKFLRVEGNISGQPTPYAAIPGWSHAPGGTNLFRSDYRSGVRVADVVVGIYASTEFLLGPGNITFDFAGSGLISLCWGDTCMSRRAPSSTMTQGAFLWEDIKKWYGRSVRFRITDDGLRDFIAVDNIVFHMNGASFAPTPVPPPPPPATSEPTAAPTAQPSWSADASNTTILFLREAKYINETRTHLRQRWANSLPKNRHSVTSKFNGIPRVDHTPCWKFGMNDGRCIDDVGMSLSVYEGPNQKVIVFHGGFHNEDAYATWASKMSIVELMEDQILDQWTTAAAQPKPEGATIQLGASARRGAQLDELASRCGFLAEEYRPWPTSVSQQVEENSPYKDPNYNLNVGIWPLVQQLVRVILPAERSVGNENLKQVILTGAGLGGAFAALVSMWLLRVENVDYHTYAFAPVGFLCWAHSMYAKEMNTLTVMPNLFIYAHVMDTWALLGKVKGNLCLYGRQSMANNKAILGYCEQIVGLTGPQLMWDGTPEPRYFGSVDEEWDAYVARVAQARVAFKACHYYTHSPWYGAMLLMQDSELTLEGTTDAGCNVIAGISASDQTSCPAETDATFLCSYQLQPPRGTPIGTMMAVAITVFSLITCFVVVLLGLYLSVDHNAWIFDLKRTSEPFTKVFIRKYCPKRVADKYAPKVKVKQKVDRAEVARERAMQRRVKSYERKKRKQKIFEMTSMQHGDHLGWQDEWWKEMVQLVQSYETIDLYVCIYKAHELRDPEMCDRTLTVCVCQVQGRANFRFVTPEVWRSSAASEEGFTDPEWNICVKLGDFASGDDLEFCLWDVGPGQKPERGDLVGGFALACNDFFPYGMKKKAVYIYDMFHHVQESTLTVEVFCRTGICPVPQRIQNMLVDCDNNSSNDVGSNNNADVQLCIMDGDQGSTGTPEKASHGSGSGSQQLGDVPMRDVELGEGAGDGKSEPLETNVVVFELDDGSSQATPPPAEGGGESGSGRGSGSSGSSPPPAEEGGSGAARASQASSNSQSPKAKKKKLLNRLASRSSVNSQDIRVSMEPLKE